MHIRKTHHQDLLLVPTYSGHIQAEDRQLIRLNLSPEQNSTVRLNLYSSITQKHNSPYTIFLVGDINGQFYKFWKQKGLRGTFMGF